MRPDPASRANAARFSSYAKLFLRWPSCSTNHWTSALAAATNPIACRIVSTAEDFNACIAIRMEVFVEEQGVPEDEERDALDSVAIHVLALSEGQAVGTGRLVPCGEGCARVGRMAVRREHRQQGIGTAILNTLLDVAASQEVETVHLAAQLHAIPFYERLQFIAEGEVFLDAGIQHRLMTRHL